MRQRNSFFFSSLHVQSFEVELVLAAIFHPRSPRTTMFVNDSFLHVLLPTLLLKLFHNHARIMAFGFTQIRSCVTSIIRMVLNFCAKCCYRSELVRNPTLFLQRRVDWSGCLFSWVVRSHLMVVYQMRCLCACWRLDWHPPIYGTCDFGVKSAYQSWVARTQQ